MYIVYKATHLPSEKVYVGQTKQKLEIRIGQHWAEYRKMTKFHQFLHTTQMNDWKWEVLKVVEDYKQARNCEMYFINLWNLYDYGLNSPTGNGPNSEANKKASERMKAYRAANPEPWHKGRKGVYSEETLNLMRLAKLKNPTRRIFSDEDKAQASLRASNSKYVQELKSGLIFNSISNAAKHFNIRREAVRDVVNGKRSHTAGLIFIRINKPE